MASHPAMGGAFTEDTLLGGRVRLRQPQTGCRTAIDPVLLAAAVPARDGDAVLDAGSGSGAAMLCLARRVPGCRITGLELQEELVSLASQNILANDIGDRVEVVAGDVLAGAAGLRGARTEPGAFDHVMANPPHLARFHGTPAADPSRLVAHTEGAAGLAAWIRFCLGLVRRRGSVTVIHRADRLEQVMAGLDGRAGDIVVFPLWPRAGAPAKRVIVRARKGVRSPTRLDPGLVLHRADGGFTPEAEAVLRDGAPLPL